MANIDKTVMKCPSDSTTQRDNIYLNLNLKTDILTGEVKILKLCGWKIIILQEILWELTCSHLSGFIAQLVRALH